MARAIITNYTYKCAQMDPQQLPNTSKFYSRSKKCDIEKTLDTTPLVARRLTKVLDWHHSIVDSFLLFITILWPPRTVNFDLLYNRMPSSCHVKSIVEKLFYVGVYKV